MKDNPEIVWLTSLPAPYRLPIWRQIGKHSKLTVFFTNGEKNKRHWNVPKDANWKSIFFNKRIFYLDQTQIIPNPLGFMRVCRKGRILVIGGGWEVPLHFTAALYARFTGRRVFIIAESTLESHRFTGKFSMLFRRFFFSLGHKVFTVGEASSTAVRKCGIPEIKIVQLFNPIDVNLFSNLPRRNKQIQSSGHNFLCVGRLIKLKNFESVIHAFINIYKEGDSLTIIGEGPELRNLQKIVGQSNLHDKIRFIGNVTQAELANYYAEAKTLVMPSLNEVWGMVAVEALSSGCHVIVSDKAGVSSSINAMQGVFVCTTEISSIKHCMIKSRKSFKNWINKPQILEFTPERFADEMLKNLT